MDDVVDRTHVEALAQWTETERHDFVIVQAGKDVSPEVWTHFGNASHARWIMPVFQPLLGMEPPAVAVAARGPDAQHVERPCFYPSMIFLYGKYSKLQTLAVNALKAYLPGACFFVLS